MMVGGGSPTPPTPTLVFYDRLVFDGTAYIETDIIPDANASFYVRIGNEATKAAQRYFFLQTTNSGYTGATLGSGTTSTTRQFGIFYGSTSSLSSNKNLSFSSYPFIGFFLTPKRFGWGNTAYTITKGSQTPSVALVIGYTPTYTGQPFTGKMGPFKIYGSDAQDVTSASGFDSYTPAYTLKPCTYGGEAGLWCEELSKFYGNTAGAGTLTVENVS